MISGHFCFENKKGEGKGFFSTYLVNVAEDGLLDGLVLDNLAQDTTVSASDNEDLLRVRVRVHGEVGDHLLVAVGISESATAIPSCHLF